MKQHRNALLAFTATAVLAACGTTTTALDGKPADPPAAASPAETPTTEAPAAGELTGQETDSLFVAFVRDEAPTFRWTPRRQLINLGHVTCDAFDSGSTFVDVATLAIDAGFTPAEGGTLIGASVAAYCPRHAGLLEEFGGTAA